jgi:hypothetical protein
MGNQPSHELTDTPTKEEVVVDEKAKYRSFPGSAILEKTFCGSIDTTDPSEYEDVNLANRLLKKADMMCVSSPEDKRLDDGDDDDDIQNRKPVDPSSAMLARALVSEVTNNPKTMKPEDMAAREYQLLKAQQAASKRSADSTSQPVGAPGGVGPPNVLSSLAFAVTGDETAHNVCVHPTHKDTTATSLMGCGTLQESRAAQESLNDSLIDEAMSPYAVTIGLSLSRRHTTLGHPDTVTRQTAFDFNELQDRQYKYVSSTDKFGWRAGGGEPGGPVKMSETEADDTGVVLQSALSAEPPQVKESSPDLIHIPIIHIDCQNQEHVDQVVSALASGEIFIPHMAVLPEALSVNGISPPDLVVRFGCERYEDLSPDEWPNWCLEFVHNQLYEYFYSLGAKWMKRPFSITLARKVKWKTVKHMNRYFAHAERVIEGWREKGPQYLDPQLSYIEGGATPEEVANPHGLYLMRNGRATNYFAPNFDPPYTTKMTISLLDNVLGKSWDKKRREWASEPIPKLVTPNLLLAMACGCTDPGADGFLAKEVTSAALRKTAISNTPVLQQAIAEVDNLSFSQGRSNPSANGHQVDEEKKTDDMAMPKSADSSDIRRPRKKVDDSAASSELGGASGYTATMSSTTVMHQNSKKTAQRILSEDWGSEQPSKYTVSGIGDSSGSHSQKWMKKKVDSKDALEKEQQLSDELLSKAKSTDSSKKTKNYTMGPVSPVNRRASNGVESRTSMEYSQDGSSSAYVNDGTSTVLGQNIDTEATFASSAAKETRSVNSKAEAEHQHDEEESGMMSLQETASSFSSVVPSDEDLLAIGWAKALDRSSGNYYYFTLDRTTIVWDNPLTMAEAPVDP